MPHSISLDFERVELVGREKEMQILRRCHSSASSPSSPTNPNAENPTCQNQDDHVIWIQGPAGSGKSCLVEHCFGSSTSKQQPHQQHSSHSYLYGAGKFCQDSTEPYQAIRDALDMITKDLLVRSEQEENEKDDPFTSWKETLREALGNEVDVLTKLVPSIASILPLDNNHQSLPQGEENLDLQHIKRVLREFVRAISTRSTLVLFWDNVQWADSDALQLLHELLRQRQNGNDNRHLVLILAHRPLISTRDPLHSLQALVPLATCIDLKDLEAADIQHFLAQLLRRETSDLNKVSEIVKQKTGGNAFFVVQFLRYLEQQGLLFYSLLTFGWQFASLDEIRAKTDISSNVVDLVTAKIRGCHDLHLKYALVSAACCGLQTLDVDTLLAVVRSLQQNKGTLYELDATSTTEEPKQETPTILFANEKELQLALDRAAQDGYLEKLSSDKYKFAHDRILESCLSMLPLGRARVHFHVTIGKCLHRLYLKSVSTNENEFRVIDSRDQLLLLAVHQMNHGATFMSDEQDQVELALLNLEAADVAMTRFAFYPALNYLESGMCLLEDESLWERQYDLMVQYLTKLAYIRFSCGKHEATEDAIRKVQKRAKTFSETLPVVETLLCLFLQQGRHEEAFQVILHVQGKLGVAVPKKIQKNHVGSQYKRVKRLLKDKTDADLLSLPEMTDEKYVSALNFTIQMGKLGCQSNQPHFEDLGIMLGMEITLLHGSSPWTCCFFGAYGLYQTYLGDITTGIRFGELAMTLCKENNNAAHAYTRCMTYFFVLHWVIPLHQCIEPMLDSYALSMKLGVTEYLYYNCGHYVFLYFCCGLCLGPLAADTKKYTQVLKDFGLLHYSDSILPYQQLVQGLMGETKDPTVMTGDFMNQDDCRKEWTSRNNLKAMQSLTMVRLIAAIYFEDLDLAEAMDGLLVDVVVEGASPLLPLRCFYQGIYFIARAKQSGVSILAKRKYMGKAKNVMKTFENWLRQGAVNCHHMMLLLKAEMVSLQGKTLDNVQRYYDDAIRAAAKLGFLHHSALSHELAGKHFLELKDERSIATDYLSRARDVYLEWDAVAKVKQMEGKYPFLDSSGNKNVAGSSLKARACVEEFTPTNSDLLKALVIAD